jgi:hypothetical protein
MRKFFRMNKSNTDQKPSVRRRKTKWGLALIASILAIFPLGLPANGYMLLGAYYKESNRILVPLQNAEDLYVCTVRSPGLEIPWGYISNDSKKVTPVSIGGGFGVYLEYNPTLCYILTPKPFKGTLASAISTIYIILPKLILNLPAAPA